MTSPKNTVLDILRWVILLPVAILGGTAAYPLSVLVVSLTTARYTGDGMLTKVYMIWISSLASGGAFVWLGAWIAPQYRGIVSVVLFGLAVIMVALVLGLTLGTPEYDGKVPLWELVCQLLATLVGGTIAVVYVSSKFGPRLGETETKLWTK